MSKLGKYDGLGNLWGALTISLIMRLEAFLEDPCEATWSDAHSIILVNATGLMLTFWQCVIAVDPTFPKSAKMGKDNATHWDRVPDFFTARRALKYAQKCNGKKAVGIKNEVF